MPVFPRCTPWARDQLTLLANGKDPWQERQASRKAEDLAARRAKTLGQVAEEYYAKRTSPDASDHWSASTARGRVGSRLRGGAR